MIESYDEEFREVNEVLTQKLNDLMVGKEIHEVVTTCLDIYTKTQSIMLSDRFKSLTEEEKDQIKEQKKQAMHFLDGLINLLNV